MGVYPGVEILDIPSEVDALDGDCGWRCCGATA